jgi:hypothetical protein
MYAALWRGLGRIIPGPVWVRVLVRVVLLTALLVVAVWALAEWVFPAVSNWMPFNDGTLN